MMGADDQRRPADRRRWDEGAHRTLVVALALTGLVLAGILAERRELWLDEYHTWWLSTMSLPSLWTFVTGDVHPPLYFALMNGWQRLASDSPLALRLPSLLAYTASVFVFAAALRPAGGTAAVRSAAVALFALSPALVYYGSEARMYALTVLLATASLACIVRLHDERGAARQSDATALAVAATLLVYTHYTGLFFLCGVGLAWLLRCLRRRAEWRPFVRFAVLAGVGTVLWLPVILEQRARKTAIDRLHVAAVAATGPASTPATRANGTAAATTPAGTVATTPGMIPWARNLAMSTASIMGVFPAPGVVLAGLLAAPFLVLVVGVLMALRSRDELAFTLLVVFAVSAAGTLIVPISRRYLLVAAPALFLLLWRGLAASPATGAGPCRSRGHRRVAGGLPAHDDDTGSAPAGPHRVGHPRRYEPPPRAHHLELCGRAPALPPASGQRPRDTRLSGECGSLVGQSGLQGVGNRSGHARQYRSMARRARGA